MFSLIKSAYPSPPFPASKYEMLVQPMLSEVESRFGSRLAEWKFTGISYGKTGPMIRFFPDKKEVYIELLEACQNDPYRGMFQLSHEVVHLLSPLGPGPSNNLEEGCATWFSVFWMLKQPNGQNYYERCKLHETPYGKPLKEVFGLLEFDEQAIIKLRSLQPKIGLISPADFQAFGNFNLSQKQVDFLCQTFAQPNL